MEVFTWNEPTRLVFGCGAVARTGTELAAMGAKRIFIVTGKGATASSEGLSRLRTSLKAQGLETVLYSEVEHDPSAAAIEAAAIALVESKADCLVAYGGGSPIDCAKSASLFAAATLRGPDGSLPPHGGVRVSSFISGEFKYEKAGLPLVAIPTTAGSGSEMSGTAVTTYSEHKKGISSPLFFPKLAIVDPEVQKTMPAALTANTGMDALTHAIECYVSKRSTSLTRSIAAGSARLILANLAAAFESPDDLEARSAMAEASSTVAIAFSQTGLGMVHGFAHPVGARAGLAHGLANAVMLPYVMEACAETAPGPYASLARDIGLAVPACDGGGEAEAAGVLVGAVVALKRRLGIPENLSAAGVPVTCLSDILADALAYRNRPSSPRDFSDQELDELLNKMY